MHCINRIVVLAFIISIHYAMHDCAEAAIANAVVANAVVDCAGIVDAPSGAVMARQGDQQGGGQATQTAGSRYEQARTLYAQGPEQAPRIIKLLEAELKDNPADNESRSLLGMTYYGIKEFKHAIEPLSLSRKAQNRTKRRWQQVLLQTDDGKPLPAWYWEKPGSKAGGN